MKKLAFIPHKERLKRHKVEYLKAISDAMENPYQSEDGRNPSDLDLRLAEKCKNLTGIKHFLFTDSCTQALQIAIFALSKPNDLILVPSYGWRAFANAALFMGRRIETVDIDCSGNICKHSLIGRLQDQTKEKPRIAIIVHNFGTITELHEISKIAREQNVMLVEDAAPAFYMKDPIAVNPPGRYSDFTCFSFDFTKYPGTLGSGGAIATNNEDLINFANMVMSHGRDPISKNINYIGTKCYMDNTSKAVLDVEIDIHIREGYRDKRREVAKWYQKNLGLKWIIGDNQIWERYTVYEHNPIRVKNSLHKLNEAGILAKTFFKEPIYNLPFVDDSLKVATEYFVNHTYHLPSHQYLTEEDLERIKNVVSL